MLEHDLNITSKNYKVYYILNWKFLLQQPMDQSVGQRISESHVPGQYLDTVYCKSFEVEKFHGWKNEL